MAKLEKYDKKTQLQIERFINSRKELYGENYFTKKYLVDKFRDIFTTMVQVRNKFRVEHSEDELEKLLKSSLGDWARSLRFTVFDYIFYERIVNDNIKTFQDGLFTIQRILFLGDRCHMSEYWDSYIMMNFRGSMAYYDLELINAYKTQTPSFFKKGYPFYIALANGLSDIFRGNLQNASDYLAEKVDKKGLTKYERSMLLATKAVADRDEAKFTQELDILVKLYPRQHFYNNLADFINIEAIGLYNLAEKIWGKYIPEPASEYWDSEFIKYNRVNKPEMLIDFSKISPIFNRWLNELPDNLLMTQLIDEIESRLSS